MSSRAKVENETLGEIQKVYRVKFGCWQIALYGIIFLPLAFFTAGMFMTREFIVLIFVIPLAAFFFGMIRLHFQDRHDELKIYRNGFTYESSNKGLQACLWKEIDYFLTGRWKNIYGVRRKDGEQIYFADAMQGIDDLTANEHDKLIGH